ncbi:MAG: RNA methyltransferase [Planctomycetaceae bacterium]
MVGRSRNSRRKLSAGPQRSWLWGRNAVLETLAAGRWLPLELRFSDELDAGVAAEVAAAAERLSIPVSVHGSTRLTDWCGRSEHQGFLALMPPFPWTSVDELLPRLPDSPLLLVLDRIQDPYNFGAILRSAEVFGVTAVIVGESGQCDITPHVARSAAGAVNHLTLTRTASLADTLRQLRDEQGVRHFVAAAGGERSPARIDMTGAVSLVIGNEGAGIAPALLSLAESVVSIPQAGRVDSLNAAVAAGVLLYEARRQRDA